MPMNQAIRSTCPYCGVGCGVQVESGSDSPHIQGDPLHPANFGRLCPKGAALGETLDMEGRLLRPRLHGRDVSWDLALDTVAGGFQAAIERYGPESVAFYVSGQLLTEDYYVANKLMKGFIGAANIDTNSRLCMSSAVVGHQRAFGEDLVTGCYEDLDLARLLVIAGGNSAWCHPMLFQRFQARREQDPALRLVVIDPRRSATAELADLHLPLRPGSDVALFNGLFRYLREQGVTDAAFLAGYTEQVQEAAAACEALDIDAVAAACDLDAGSVLTFYRWFTEEARAVTLFSQGINQSTAGSDKVNAIINCHLLTGRIGKPGAGPFSLTGQPNAMGGREVGALATSLAAHMGFDPVHRDRVARFWHSPGVAGGPGPKAVELFERMAAGDIKAVWIIGTNPVVSMPDADKVRQALRRCELVVVSDCVAQTDTTALADVLLPAATWGEKDGTVTNSERRISRQRAFLPVPGEARPDWWMLCQVASRLGHGEAFAYEGPAAIFREHAALSAFENEGDRLFNIGGLAELDQAAYDALEPLQWPITAPGAGGCKRLAIDGGQTARPLRFVAVHPRGPAHAPTDDYPLILNSGRVRDHWHTLARSGKSPRLNRRFAAPFVAVHPEDALALGLREGHLARLESRWGRMVAEVQLDAGLRRGELFAPMHWNDQFSRLARVGAVVNPAVDPLSGEPEFKHTPVRLLPLPMAWFGFLLLRVRPDPAALPGLAHWVRVREAGHWRLEMAGEAAPARWHDQARRALGAVKPQAEWLEFTDPRAGVYRLASLDARGRLEACLMLAPEPARLPSRRWLGALFKQERLEAAERAALLAGGHWPAAAV